MVGAVVVSYSGVPAWVCEVVIVVGVVVISSSGVPALIIGLTVVDASFNEGVASGVVETGSGVT